MHDKRIFSFRKKCIRNYSISKVDSGSRQNSQKELIVKIINGFKMVDRVLESPVTLYSDGKSPLIDIHRLYSWFDIVGDFPC